MSRDDSKADRPRCDWAKSPEMVHYHDTEWGRPVHDENRLFEFLTLEGAQAGLSWETILKKREGYRRLFADFDVEKVARFDADDVDRLVQDTGIVRNRKKIESTIGNARAILALRQQGLDLDTLLWGFVEGQPIVNEWKTMAEVPSRSELSDRMAKELKKLGFRFVGSTICYALMQAVGIVDDHLVSCFRRRDDG